MADITRPHVDTVVWEGGNKYVVYVRQNEGIRFRVDFDAATGALSFYRVGAAPDGQSYRFEPERGIFKLLLEAVTRWIANQTAQAFGAAGASTGIQRQRFITTSELRERWNERGETKEEHEPTRGEDE